MPHRAREDQFEREAEHPAGIAQQRDAERQQDNRYTGDHTDQPEHRGQEPEKRTAKPTKKAHIANIPATHCDPAGSAASVVDRTEKATSRFGTGTPRAGTRSDYGTWGYKMTPPDDYSRINQAARN